MTSILIHDCSETAGNDSQGSNITHGSKINWLINTNTQLIIFVDSIFKENNINQGNW